MKKKENGLSAWQLTMMAVGSVIGGSFFVGSSVAIKAAGPSVLLAYIFAGILVYFILFAISEMTVANTDSGSFRTFAAQAFGQGTGFVVGWVYWAGLTLGISSEATAISLLVRAWYPNVSIAILGSIVIIFMTLLNLLEADKLSKLESAFASIKVLAIICFSVIALLLIFGLYPGRTSIGAGSLSSEAFMPGGFTKLAGSMLIVMFAYSGFEVIGFTASEAREPTKTVPRAIRQTVVILIGIYILSAAVLLPLIPTSQLSVTSSPMVFALNTHGFGWAGTALTIVLITAILSTMLATLFGLARTLQSLADEGLAPKWLKDKTDVPYRGIIFTGISMLAGLGIGFLFPNVYLFLVSSGGFAMLFTYAVIMATHIRFRKSHGCPPHGKCQLWGFPYTSAFVLIMLVLVIISMPFVEDQISGLIAGCLMVILFSAAYLALRYYRKSHNTNFNIKREYLAEVSEELSDFDKKDDDKKKSD